MKAHNRQLAEWLEEAIKGNLMLPRFQRKEAWTYAHAKRFIEAMLRGHPLGVFLVLRVDPDNQPFGTKRISEHQRESRCTEHLLDGQQRLTALLNVFLDSYEKHTYYVNTKEDPHTIEAIPRRGPLKAVIGDARAEYRNGWIPCKLLNPMSDSTCPGTPPHDLGISWREDATTEASERRHIEVTIGRLRGEIAMTHIPWIALPQSTNRTEAIKIFIDTNRSAVNLSMYDIAVAQMEELTKHSLHEFVNEVNKSVPKLKALNPTKIGDLILKSECVTQDMKPTDKGYLEIDFFKLNDESTKRIDAIRWTVNQINRMKIWKHRQLPTTVPLRVLPSLHKYMPDHGTELARAMKIIRLYLWSSFLTDRYDTHANDRLKVDYDCLKESLTNPNRRPRIPALAAAPPSIDEIRGAGWPRSRRRLSRAILAVCCQGGARDIASNEEIGPQGHDDYHHIFPRALLKGLTCDADLAVNCMLLTVHTNRRQWLKKLPGDFLTSMQEDAIMRQSVSDPTSEIKNRLATHHVPEDMLLSVTKSTTQDVKRAYEQFVTERAKMIKLRIAKLLAEGEI